MSGTGSLACKRRNLARWSLIIAACFVAAVAVATSVIRSQYPKASVPTYEATLQLDPARYDDFTRLMDAALKDFGLTRFSDDGGLDTLQQRKVFYADYRLSASDKAPFLIATDVVKAGNIRISIYAQALPPQLDQQAIMSRLNAGLARIGVPPMK